MAKLDAIKNRLTKMDGFINMVHDRCEACRGPHSTRDCELEYKRDRDTKEFQQLKHNLYQIEQVQSEKVSTLESMLFRFMEASEKRHDATDATLREQQESILRIHTQFGELTKLMKEKLLDTPLRKSESIPISQVMVVYT